jgi:protein MpaA
VTIVLGHSALGRPIRAIELGDPTSPEKVLVVGCIHGTECAGIAVTRLLERAQPRFDLWLVPNLNPDGLARGTRQNGRGVDLNRNFPSEWRARGRRGDPEYPGPRPSSEPETRIAETLIRHLRPRITIWFHQPQDVVRAWGGSVSAARRFAGLAGLPFRRIRWPAGTASNWQNHRFPGTSSFVVELPSGPLSPAAAARLARAVRLLPK